VVGDHDGGHAQHEAEQQAADPPEQPGEDPALPVQKTLEAGEVLVAEKWFGCPAQQQSVDGNPTRQIPWPHPVRGAEHQDALLRGLRSPRRAVQRRLSRTDHDNPLAGEQRRIGGLAGMHHSPGEALGCIYLGYVGFGVGAGAHDREIA
jgi:hypothetical protein